MLRIYFRLPSQSNRISRSGFSFDICAICLTLITASFLVEKYNLPIVVWPSICPGPPLLVMMGMMGWTEFSIGLRKNPELVKACTEIGSQFLCGSGKALVDEAQVDALTMCAQDGGFPFGSMAFMSHAANALIEPR